MVHQMLGQCDRGVKAEINQKEAGAVELDRRISAVSPVVRRHDDNPRPW
jgi:hypothetical protein